MNSPVLFVIFKRDDTTRRVFERIREAQPPRLYIAADGPREGHSGEHEACERTRQVVSNVDWPCKTYRLYRDQNMGCGRGMSSAISWFFEYEEQGIIIEDDILPHLDFFRYCDEMLDRYKDDERIQMVSGFNYFYDGYTSDVPYYLSTFASIWGWATWRRVWDTYQYDVNQYPEENLRRKIMLRMPQGADNFFLQVYHQMRQHLIDTWDYQFVLNQIYYDRYSLSPFTNMIENIGMGDVNATHTTAENKMVTNHKSHSPFPFEHPLTVMPSETADKVAMINSGQYARTADMMMQILQQPLFAHQHEVVSTLNYLSRKSLKYQRQLRILAYTVIMLQLLILLAILL